MKTIEEIKAIVNRVVDLSKNLNSKKVRELLTTDQKRNSKYIKKIYPEYYSFYRSACEMRDHIIYHAEISDFPSSLFIERAPRMNDEEFDYIEANFKQTSLPVYLDFLSTINRIFNDSSWSCVFPDGSTKPSFREYCEEGVPKYGSLESFMKSYIPHLKLTDAGGCIAVRPNSFNLKESTDEEGSTIMKIDDSIPFEPIPLYFSCEQLVGYESDEYYLFESSDKSQVEYLGKQNKVGRMFEFYDEGKIVFISQVGKYSDHKFEFKIMVQHDWNRIPVQFLKGVPKITTDGTLWISPFSYAVDLLDLVLLNETNLQTSINSCVYPYRIIEGNECDFEFEDRDGNKITCDNGFINDIGIGSRFACPSCGGSGLRSNMGAMGVMIIKQPSALDQSSGTASRLRDPVMFVSPPIEPLDLLLKKISSDETKARKILHLQDSSSSVQPTSDANSPALKTALDLKGLYAFLATIANQIFDMYVFMHESSSMFMYGVDKYKEELPLILYPVSYDFKTDSDYLAEISEATNSNLPPHVIHTIVYRYISALFINDKKTASVFLLIVATDRLLVFSSTAIEMKKKDGLTQDWEIILHDSGLSLIDQISSSDPKYFDDEATSFDQRKAILIQKAKDLANLIKAERIQNTIEESKAHAEAIMRATQS